MSFIPPDLRTPKSHDWARLEAAGKGAGSPVATNGNDVGRAQNRRVELAKR